MHPRQLGVAHRLPGRLQVLRAGAGEAADDRHVAGQRVHRVAHVLGDGAHRGKVVGRGDGEPGLDDVHAWGGGPRGETGGQGSSVGWGPPGRWAAVMQKISYAIYVCMHVRLRGCNRMHFKQQR